MTEELEQALVDNDDPSSSSTNNPIPGLSSSERDDHIVDPSTNNPGPSSNESGDFIGAPSPFIEPQVMTGGGFPDDVFPSTSSDNQDHGDELTGKNCLVI